MARYEKEFAERQIAELDCLLRAWKANEDSDSVRIQNLRKSEMGVGRRLIRGLIYGVQPEHQLQLTVGDEAIKGASFSKGAYDFYSINTRDLDPGTVLPLVRDELFSERDGVEFYVGRFVLVTLPAMAQTLRQHGALSLVEAEVAATAAPTSSE